MRHCFIVFAEPGHAFQSVHRTVEGAVHSAAALGAAVMPDGSLMTIDCVRELFGRTLIACGQRRRLGRSRVSLAREAQGDLSAVAVHCS